MLRPLFASLLSLAVVRAADHAPAAAGWPAAGDPAAPPGAAATAGAPEMLDAFVVRDRLDKAREDIVPGLGAAEFHLDRTQIDLLPLGANAGFNEILLRVPGVAQDSFGQVHLRGEHADLQYRINDVLLPEGLSGFGQELDTRFVGTVSVLTGALPAQYGYRTAGVVDIHTRTAAQNGGEATLYGGSFGTWRGSVEATGTSDRLSAYATASAERSDLGIENPTPARRAIHDHKDQEKLFAYTSAVISPTSRLNVMLSSSLARFEIPNRPDLVPGFTLSGAPVLASADLNERQHEENDYAVVALEKTGPDVSGQVSAFTRYSRVSFLPDPVGDLEYNGVASRVRRALVGNGVEANAKWEAAAAHTIRFGAIATTTNAGTRASTTVFPVDASGAVSSTEPFEIVDNHRRLGWVGGGYFQDEWKPAPKWTINSGARADTSQGYRREGQLSPRVNVVYALSDRATVHAGYARYFTPPPLELVQPATVARFNGTTNAAGVTASSPVLAERAHDYDLGVALKLTPDVSATLDAYAKESRNQLDEGQFGQALIFSPFNYRRGRTDGVELSANYSHGGWSAYTNVAVSRGTARAIISGEFQFDPDELAYIATHDVHPDHDQRITASGGVAYRFGASTVMVDALYGSGLRRGFANTDHLPPNYPVNLGFEHTFRGAGRRELKLRIDVVNVFDQRYELRDGSGIGVGAPQFGMRRALFGGVTFAF